MSIIKKVLADTITVPFPDDPLKGKFATAGSIFAVAMNLVFTAAFVIGLAYVIISGVKLATSGGDKLALQSAKKSLTWAIVGVFVIVGFRALIEIIGKLLGATTLPGTIPSF